MRICLDHCVPAGLRHHLKPHTIFTAREAALDAVKDGALLSLLRGKCDVLLTVDQNMQFQNTLRGQPFGILILRPRRTVLPLLVPLVPELLRVLDVIQPGELVLIQAQ